MTTPCSSCQPPWCMPTPESVTHNVGLKVANSLTRQKDLFVTSDGSKHVRWYMCGPTVYAPSHMGHARAYLSFDILRRIMEDYFGYDVTLIMNITDVDDKVIERANEQKVPPNQLTEKFEAEFHRDMANLGVQPPSCVTRVTEFMPEITVYIEELVKKDLAYASEGSVYFDVEAFEKLEDFHYCKLEPEQVRNAELLAEGEGKLTQTHVSQKKSARDFALWKATKHEYEPSWPSPWGAGRPGWHIECSVMASDVLEKLSPDGNDCSMDIHSGGIDLKFPHHDNEMAQSEAKSGCHQWVNYFIHAGHLHIQGFKMSKSLKNFITIEQALQEHTARQIRLLFLLHKYNAPMDYGDNSMSHALVTEKLFSEFFHNSKAVLREFGINQHPQKWGDATMQLQRDLQLTQRKVDAALKDDFDTPTAIAALVTVVKATNVYVDNKTEPVIGTVVRNVAAYVTKILSVLGLDSNSSNISAIGFSGGDDSGAAASKEEVLEPVLNCLMQFRSMVRDGARQGNTQAILQQCDHFRDEVLPPLGIRLEDKGGTKSVWKIGDPQELMREREQLRLEAERKAQEKEAAKAAQAAKDALNALPPVDFMKQLTIEDPNDKTKMIAKYSKFDDSTGLPTHYCDGEPLNKNQGKKAQKEFAAQQKKYDKYMQQQAKE